MSLLAAGCPGRARRCTRWLAGLWLALCAGLATAHETPIALLELRELDPGRFYENWTYSSSLAKQNPTALYPKHCRAEDHLVDCGAQGLVGRLEIERLGVSYSGAVVKVYRKDQAPQSFTLTGAQPSVLLTPDGKLPLSQIIGSYVPLGFEHILLGVDHLLFVFGLMLLVSSLPVLIKTITAFTVAHSLTLAAATLGWIGVPAASVNALIALSIVIVAVEVVELRRGGRPWGARFPWAVAFFFGLLHGFGFATALTEQGLPAESVPAALLFFNVGVEIGQIAFVLLVIALNWAHRRLTALLPDWSRSAGIYFIGGIGGFWFISRLIFIIAPPEVLS